MNIDRSTKVRLINLAIGILCVGLIVLLWPVARGLGLSLGFGEPERVVAHAELVRAQTTEWQALTGFLDPLSTVIAYIGQASVQLALAGIAVLLGSGVAAILFAFAHNITISGKVRLQNAEMATLPPAKEGRLLAAPKRNVSGNRGRGNRDTGDVVSSDIPAMGGGQHVYTGGGAFIGESGFGSTTVSASTGKNARRDSTGNYAQRAAARHARTKRVDSR